MPDWLPLVVFLLLPLCGILYFLVLKKTLRGEVGTRYFSRIDAVLAVLLCVFFLWMGIAGASGERVVTLDGVIQGGLFYSCLLIAVLAFLMLRGIPIGKAFGLLPPHPGRQALIACGLLAAAYPIVLAAQFLSYQFAEPEDTQQLVQFLARSEEVFPRLAVGLVAIVVAPLVEEFLFRGYFYGVARESLGKPLALLVTSIAFSAIHAHLPSFLGLFVLGAVLGIIRERTGTVWAAVFAHAIFNGISVGATLLWPDLVP